MDATETELTIFGWTLGWPSIVAAGVVIAAAIGTITLATDGQFIHSLIPPCMVCLVSALLAWAARLIFRRRRIEEPNDILMLCVTIRVANVIALGLLGLAALLMLLVGQPSWLNLFRAFFNSLVFGAGMIFLSSTIANLLAFGRVTGR